MNAFDVLGDPIRRRILELLLNDELPAGEIVEVISKEFGLTQAGVSQHLRILRDSGFTTVTPQGTKRLYKLENRPLQEIDAWLSQFRSFWETHLDSLEAEITRSENERKSKKESS